MGTVCRIGLDIAKNFFQVHGVDKHGKDVFNKKLKRIDVLPFLPICHPASSALKPVEARIGHGSLPGLMRDIPCGWIRPTIRKGGCRQRRNAAR